MEWKERVSPAEPVAVLTLARGDLSTADALAQAQIIDGMAFNPWNTTDEFRPLGNLNRARKAVYDASSAQRLGYRWQTQPPLRNVVLGAAVRAVFAVVNRYVPWHRLPVRLGLLNLEAFRYVLRARNLFDSEVREAPPQARPVPPAPPGEDVRVDQDVRRDQQRPVRARDGLGGIGVRPEPARRISGPTCSTSPTRSLVSQQLLHREHVPARAVAEPARRGVDPVPGARLGRTTPATRSARPTSGCPLPPGMTWSNTPDGPPEQRDADRREHPVPRRQRPNPMSPVFANGTTPWWDGSEVYGADPAKSSQLREGAKLRLTRTGTCPTTPAGFEITGFNESWWLGLGSLHTLFAREHNLLCDELRAHYRDWSDERIYQTARLIVSALIAKIHTVEWTPAILGTEVIDIGLQDQLERAPGARLADPAGHLADRQPRQRRHPEDHAGPQRRAVLADRGLRHGLPDAPAAARRLPVRRPPDRGGPRPPRVPRHPGRDGRRGTARLRPGEHAVLLRPVPSRRDHPAQLPALAAEVRAQRRADRPVGGGSGAHPPPRRAPLQRLPGRAAQAADQALGRALRRTRSRSAG